ncbi:hypothetical protein GCK32_003925 [Trichostrongylus colubriformis]|uniref:Uncharacterized protein n=1 Tax=Trichostrongylus colubriformis TaxID=6319 RepID=A0AAN8FNL4_TRICO
MTHLKGQAWKKAKAESKILTIRWKKIFLTLAKSTTTAVRTPKSRKNVLRADEVAHEQHCYTEKQRKLELERRKSLIRAFLTTSRNVPARKISYQNSMRPEDTFLVCSFCLAKGKHYSDSCPGYASVQSGMEGPDALSVSTAVMKRKIAGVQEDSACTVGEDHNKVLCTLPYHIHDSYGNLPEVEKKLASYEDVCRSSFRPRPSTFKVQGGVSQREHSSKN